MVQSQVSPRAVLTINGLWQENILQVKTRINIKKIFLLLINMKSKLFKKTGNFFIQDKAHAYDLKDYCNLQFQNA